MVFLVQGACCRVTPAAHLTLPRARPAADDAALCADRVVMATLAPVTSRRHVTGIPRSVCRGGRAAVVRKPAKAGTAGRPAAARPAVRQ